MSGPSMRWLVPLALAACTPDWVHDAYAPTARAQAVAAAVRDHGCPADRIRLRCDATAVIVVMDGKLAVGADDDSAVQSLVEHVPQWEFELDVCGHVMRYTHEQRAEPPFVERRAECARGPACASLDRPCRSIAAGGWWPVLVAGPPADCADATIDWGIAATVERGRLEVGFATPTDVDGDCNDPSLLVGVDDRWFALCGTGVATPTTHVASGLGIPYGTHQVTVLHRAAHCRQSLPSPIRLDKPIQWTDL